MKICPQCETGYHDSHVTCPTHGGMLSEIRDLRPGMLIRGTYRITRKLGKGGMGAVYLAQHTLLGEPRALKFLSQELSEDEAFTSRFLREVRTLRQVRNRNVVDCGDPERAEDGSLFFSMEYVDGPNLRDFMKTASRPFDVAQALRISHGIAEGLGAAHAKGMVHRDIKPENILMAREGIYWVPKIADFGIVATREVSQHTQTGSTLLTMAYAAPEQWMGTRAADLDGRTDLYALGGVLFELLTGQTVFEAENYHGWAQKHLNAPPIAPSSLRPELARWRGLDPFVLRLLAKDRNERPANVPEFIDEICAIVYDPAVADRASDPYAPTAAFTPTRPGQGPQAVPSSQASHGPHASGPRPRVEPMMSGGAQPHRLAPASDAGSRSPSAEIKTISGAGKAAGVVAESRSSGANKTVIRTSRGTVIPLPGAASDPSSKVRKSVPPWVWLGILILAVAGAFIAQHYYKPKARFVTLQSQTAPILSVAFSPNGLTLASASHDNTIQLWDMDTMKATGTLADHVDAVTYSPDGHYLASADWDKDVKLWDAASGQVLATFSGHTDQVLAVAFSPDGHTLASGSRDRTIKLWDVAGDKLLRTLKGNTADVNSIAFSPDGRILASGGADDAIKLWDPTTGKLLQTLQGHAKPVNSIAFSPDGKMLASASDDNTIDLWEVASGKIVLTLQGHTGAVHSVAFSPDGRTLASGSEDTTVKLWDVAGSPAGAFKTLEGHTAAVLSVAFNVDGSNLASGSADNSVRIWYGPTDRH